jgi:putative transposase
VLCVFSSIKQRICFHLHALQECGLRWFKPLAISFVLGTFADLIRGRAELLAENALLRHPLLILRQQVKRPTYRKQDRLLLILPARMVRTWKQALFIIQPETLLRGPRELFRVFWKHTSKARSSKPRLSHETITLIREMAANNRHLRCGAHWGELLKLDIRGSQTDHPEGYEADSRHFESVDRTGGLSCALMLRKCGPVIFCRSQTSSSVRFLPLSSSN